MKNNYNLADSNGHTLKLYEKSSACLSVSPLLSMLQLSSAKPEQGFMGFTEPSAGTIIITGCQHLPNCKIKVWGVAACLLYSGKQISDLNIPLLSPLND